MLDSPIVTSPAMKELTGEIDLTSPVASLVKTGLLVLMKNHVDMEII
jgi:hypothetical protein